MTIHGDTPVRQIAIASSSQTPPTHHHLAAALDQERSSTAYSRHLARTPVPGSLIRLELQADVQLVEAPIRVHHCEQFEDRLVIEAAMAHRGHVDADTVLGATHN